MPLRFLLTSTHGTVPISRSKGGLGTFSLISNNQFSQTKGDLAKEDFLMARMDAIVPFMDPCKILFYLLMRGRKSKVLPPQRPALVSLMLLLDLEASQVFPLWGSFLGQWELDVASFHTQKRLPWIAEMWGASLPGEKLRLQQHFPSHQASQETQGQSLGHSLSPWFPVTLRKRSWNLCL